MNPSRISRHIVSLVAALAMLLPATASAEAPENYWVEWSYDNVSRYISRVCGFPIRLHSEGTYHYIVRYDEKNDATIETVHNNFHGYIYANGKELKSVVLGPTTTIYSADGSMTVIQKGAFHRNVPGVGFVGTAGRYVWQLTFDKNGEFISEELVSASGREVTQEAVCQYLAP